MHVNHDQFKFEVIKILSQPTKRVVMEVPVNMCPDDDPPGERPMKGVFVNDITSRVEKIMEVVEHAREVARSEGYEAGYSDGYKNGRKA